MTKSFQLITRLFMLFTVFLFGSTACAAEEDLNALTFKELLHVKVGGVGKGIFLPPGYSGKDKSTHFLLIVPLSLSPKFSTELIVAADLAAIEINKQGGINGKPLELVRVDDMGSDEKSIVLTEQAIQQYPIKAIIGPVSSSRTINIAKKIAIPKQVPLISPSASANVISFLDDSGWVYRLFASNEQQSEQIALFLSSHPKVTRVAMIGDRSIYSRELEKGIRKKLISKGIKVEKEFDVSRWVDYKTFDLQEQIVEIQKTKPSALIFSVRQHQIVDLMNQVNETWVGDLPIIVFTDTVKSQPIIDANLKRLKPCMYIVSTKNDQQSSLLGKISSLLDMSTADYNAAYTYDSVVIFAMSYAISEKYKIDFRKVLSKLTSRGEEWSIEHFSSLLNNFNPEKSYTYSGQIGTVIFNTNGDNVASMLSISKIFPTMNCH